MLLFIPAAAITGCKNKQGMSNNSNENTTTTEAYSGVVSHKYKATGCTSVIILEDREIQMILIPKDPIDLKLDVDGQKVSFNYRPLKMPQPSGCATGIPAEITDLKKK